MVFPRGRTTPQRFPSLITDNKEKVSNFCMKLWTSNVANEAILIFFPAMLEVFSQCVFTEQTQQYSIKLLNVFSSLKHITAVITPFPTILKPLFRYTESFVLQWFIRPMLIVFWISAAMSLQWIYKNSYINFYNRPQKNIFDPITRISKVFWIDWTLMTPFQDTAVGVN